MKHMIILALIVCSSAINALYAQKEAGFSIHGKLTGLKDGTVVKLVHNKLKKPDTLMRTVALNESFTFKGNLPLEGEAYFIFVDTVTTKYENRIKGKYIV